MAGNDPKLLNELTHHGLSRMFSRFHMPPRRQPQLRPLVIDEKNMIPINNGKV